jgi:hypothetical protein
MSRSELCVTLNARCAEVGRIFEIWSRRAGLNRGPADYEAWRDGPSQMWPDFADLSAPIGYR